MSVRCDERGPGGEGASERALLFMLVSQKVVQCRFAFGKNRSYL